MRIQEANQARLQREQPQIVAVGGEDQAGTSRLLSTGHRRAETALALMKTDNDHLSGDIAAPRPLGPQASPRLQRACWSLGLGERTLRNLVACGELASVKIGRRTLFDPSDLQVLTQAHRTVRGAGRKANGQELVKQILNIEKIRHSPLR